jgi:hypothetical protein
MTVEMRSRAVPATPACRNGEPSTRASPALDSSARACETSGAAGDPVAGDMNTGSVKGDRPSGDRVNQAENELPQPQPPVLFGFLNVKPEPCIDDT